MPTSEVNSPLDQTNSLISDELNYDRVALAQEFLLLMSTMTTEQRHIYDTIMSSVQRDHCDIYFVSGFSGSGKTYIWRALSSILRSKGEIVLTVASNGIAALLIPGGELLNLGLQFQLMLMRIQHAIFHMGVP